MADEDELELGERDHDEEVDFPPSDRKIHTQAYDLSLTTLAEQWADETLLIPDFQREYVWDNAKASRLIESLLLNIPIPSVFLAETADATYEVVDGHQRVFSIVRYLDNQFPLTGLRISQELKGMRFHQLPPREQRFLKTRVVRAVIISSDSAANMKFEVFERLNTGGVALNAQEVRNAIFGGPLNDLARTLEHNVNLRACIGTKTPRKRMVDRELVLRFLALSDGFDSYRPPLVRFLNDYARHPSQQNRTWLNARRERFESTVAVVQAVLGTSAFRVIDSKGGMLERNINRAVYDAEMLVFSACDPKALQSRRTKVIANLGHLFEDADFLDSIRRATGDRARTFERVRDVGRAVEQAGVAFDSKRLGKL